MCIYVDVYGQANPAPTGKGQNATFKKIIQKGKECGEALWELPIFDDMQDMLKSDVADMRNTGSRFAGASVAGRFLQNFTKRNFTFLPKRKRLNRKSEIGF